jgi:hypothetical protein
MTVISLLPRAPAAAGTAAPALPSNVIDVNIMREAYSANVDDVNT